MNKNLESKMVNKSRNQGFTLIELLVVISVIAILSSIGIVFYSQVGARARDSKRRTDVDEFKKAMELNYDDRASVYSAPIGSMFSSGLIPQDPSANYSYKFKSTTYNSNNLGAIPASGTYPDYEICAQMEITGTGNSDASGNPQANGPYYCQHNSR